MPTAEAITVYEADEGVLRLEQKLDLVDHERVRVFVEPMPEEPGLALRLAGRIVIAPEVARQIIENEDLWGDD